MIPAQVESAPLLFVDQLRDWIIIVWGLTSILLLLALIILVVTLVFSVKRLIAEVQDLLISGVRPLLASARESADNVTGTTRFVGDKVVTPIIRVIGIVSGVRRGIAVFSGLTGRGKSDAEKEHS